MHVPKICICIYIYMKSEEWDRADLEQVHAFLVLEMSNGNYIPPEGIELPPLDLP